MNAYEFIIKMKDMASSQLQNITRSVGVAKNELYSFNTGMNTSEKTANKLGGTMGKLKGIIAGVFAIAAIGSFTDKVVGARSEYERFESVLTNTFQSAQVGKGALNMLTDFASKTPFALNELTGSFVKLVNRGFNPTKEELKNLGDLASSQGKGFDQLTEAMLDAQTGQFERLKEIGITASKHGDKVMMSFKGVNKEVANNSTAITRALLEYGKMPGVAGSMAAESKTLGGMINNLGDDWNKFLVAVGGESGGVFTGVISMLSGGLKALTAYLPYVSEWFSILWSMIEPVITSFSNFIQLAFGISGVSNVMGTFGNIMSGLLVVVGWFTTGLNAITQLLTPFATGIVAITAAWWLWNSAVGIFNALMLVNPITWVVLGVVALIMVIGMVMKYTSGWGESWRYVVNGAKFLWQGFIDNVKANFNNMTNSLMIGIDKIKIGWYKFKESVGMGNSTENQKMISDINNDVENRKKSISDGYRKMLESAQKAKNEFSQIGITVDTNGIKKDWNGLKSKFSGLGQTDTSTAAYDNYLAKKKGALVTTDGKTGMGDKNKSDSIVSGGSKMTNINITIEKLGTDTTINVDKAENGINRLQELIQEALLRALNSVNQLQTG